MPQVEEGTTATTFVANTSGNPKFITGATFGPRSAMILVEPSATNLIGNSDFSSGWSLSSGATVEQTTESTPMASQTALRLTSTQIGSRYQAPSAYSSGSSTASVYIKWDGVDTRFRINRGLSNSDVLCNVTQGGVTHHSNTSDGYSIEEHGDGWWRVSNTMTNPTWVQLYADAEDGDGSILVALPQHEAGSIPTSFIPTSGGNAAARTRASDDLQIERDSTNLVPYSEDFSQWSTKSGATLTANYGISPDGTQNSTRLQFSGASNQLADNITTSSSSTGSVWVKGTSGETIRFGVYASEANFTLNGSWQRIQKQGTATSNILTINTYGGATARDLEIWGGQLEDGSEATSYIPTSGAAASRTTFSDFYNASEGTFYVESSTNSDAPAYIFEASYNVGNPYENRHLANFNASNNLKVLSRTSGNVQYGGQSLATYTNNQLTRLAYSYKQSDFRVSFNGEAEPTPSGSQVPSADINQLYLGDAHITGAAPLNGHIKRLIYWPYHSDSL